MSSIPLPPNKLHLLAQPQQLESLNWQALPLHNAVFHSMLRRKQRTAWPLKLLVQHADTVALAQHATANAPIPLPSIEPLATASSGTMTAADIARLAGSTMILFMLLPLNRENCFCMTHNQHQNMVYIQFYVVAFEWGELLLHNTQSASERGVYAPFDCACANQGEVLHSTATIAFVVIA